MLKVSGKLFDVSLVAGSGLSSARIAVEGQVNPVIVNLPLAMAQQLVGAMDKQVTLTITEAV